MTGIGEIVTIIIFSDNFFETFYRSIPVFNLIKVRCCPVKIFWYFIFSNKSLISVRKIIFDIFKYYNCFKIILGGRSIFIIFIISFG